jgi:hypothetical protein
MFNTGDIVSLTIENGDGGYGIVLEIPEGRFRVYHVYSMIIENTMTVYEHEMTKI